MTDEPTITEQNALKWVLFTEAYDRIAASPWLDAEGMWFKMRDWIGLVR